MTEQYACPSYYDDNGLLQDCTCGKCAEPILKDVEGIKECIREANAEQREESARLNTPDTELEDNIKSALSSNPALRDKLLALIPTKDIEVTPDTEWSAESKIYDAFYMRDMDALTNAVIELKTRLQTSRDTYWKEQLQKAREEERGRIEAVFKEHVPPHAMDLEDSVWLKRLLNKAFNHDKNI